MADISRFMFGASRREAELAEEVVAQGERVAELMQERNAAQAAAHELQLERNKFWGFTGRVCSVFRKSSGIQKAEAEAWADHTLVSRICNYFEALSENHLARAERLAEQEQELASTREALHAAEQFASQASGLREQIRELTQERDRLHEKLNRLEDGSYVAQFNRRSLEVHEWAQGKGWWQERGDLWKVAGRHVDSKFQNFTKSVIQSSLIALIHSELSEALEAIRHGNPPDDKIPEFTGLEAELADTVIRIHDMAGAYKLRVGEAIEAKMAFNHTREHKHGGKVV
jgi:NTP pyrophosphatase (non-canonical NTP hydrolase)/cell division protein FtsB